MFKWIRNMYKIINFWCSCVLCVCDVFLSITPFPSLIVYKLSYSLNNIFPHKEHKSNLKMIYFY